jgi:hypothetical protein
MVGPTFSNPILLSNGASFSFRPDVAVDKNNNNVYVVLTRVTTASEIVIEKSTDGGVSFGPPVVLNPGPLTNGRAGVVAVDSKDRVNNKTCSKYYFTRCNNYCP